MSNTPSRFLDDYPDVLVPEELMPILQVGRNRVYSMLRNGEIESIRLGKQYRIPKKSVVRFIYGETEHKK